MTTLDRRTFLKGAGVLGAAGLAGPAISKDWAFARGPLGTPATPIEHILIDCQENRSFDTTSATRRSPEPSGRPPDTRSPTATAAARSPTASPSCPRPTSDT